MGVGGCLTRGRGPRLAGLGGVLPVPVLVVASSSVPNQTNGGLAAVVVVRADEPLVTVPLLSLPLLNTCLHTAFKQRSLTPYAFPLLASPSPEGAEQAGMSS